jgi:hypothetical protein
VAALNVERFLIDMVDFFYCCIQQMKPDVMGFLELGLNPLAMAKGTNNGAKEQKVSLRH